MPERDNKPLSPAKVRLIVFGALAVALAAGGWYMVSERMVGMEHDRIVRELLNEGDYAQAARELEALRPRAGWFVREQVLETLAEAYVRAGDDPGMPITDAARYYRKAEAIDPALIDARRRQTIEAGEARQERRRE